MATPEILAAVSAAVKGEDLPAPADTAAPVVDPPEADEPPAAPASAGKEDLIGDPPAGEEPADGAPARGPDGKFVAKKATDPAAEEPKAPAAAAEPPKASAPAEPPKPVDHVNDPIPDGVKAATRERIVGLVETVKAERAEKETLQNDMEVLLTPIREANATVEQFQEAMNLVKLLNSPHQYEQMQALQYLQNAGATLAERLGQVPPGADPLAGHNDLIAEVNAGKLSEQRAVEIARGRRQQAASQQFQQQSQQRSQQEEARQNGIKAGQAAVRAVEQALEASDTRYAEKIAVVRADTAFLSKMRAMLPTQWSAAFAERYRSVVLPPAPGHAPAARAGGPAPLRPKNPAGNTAKPPANMLEAVKGGLAQLAAR